MEFLGDVLVPLVAAVVKPFIPSVVKGITRVLRAKKGQEGGCFPLIEPTSLLSGINGKGVTRAGKGYNNMDNNHIGQNF